MEKEATKPCLLLAEDEINIGEGLAFNFEQEGYEVQWLTSGQKALEAIRSHIHSIDVIILDLMLPQVGGYELLEQARLLAEKIPILILSAKSSEGDKIRAFELGADDFVTKPFHLNELLLRIKRLLQRSQWIKKEENQEAAMPVGISLFFPKKLLIQKNDGQSFRVTPIEAQLVQVLLDNKEKILSRQDLLSLVWQYDKPIETRTVDVFVGKIRKYIEENPADPQFLISVRGAGYMYSLQGHNKELT